MKLNAFNFVFFSGVSHLAIYEPNKKSNKDEQMTNFLTDE